MNAAVVCVAGIAVFAAGYWLYSGYLARRVFALRPDEPVPARERADGVDYVPTNRHVLLGHHYTSIAGAAPIIGPAIAVVWGWVPAVLWVVLGTVFMGAVHDMSTLVMSMRHDGRSVGHVVADVIGPRTRTLFLLVIFCLVMLVTAVFAKAVAGLFVSYPGTVLPINFEIVVALAIGWACMKRGVPLLWPSIAALVALYAMVFVGVKVPIALDFLGDHQTMFWIVFLLVYALIASVLPVWVLLQPRDYINSHQLIVGLAALIVGILIAHPAVQAPAFAVPPADAPPWFPFLFVTIACGAISGFHGLVSSGTTSKQIACATDARLIGYGGMIGEGTLALVATLAVSAGLGQWAAHYDSFAHAATGGVGNFVEGASTFLGAVGIPAGAASVVVGVLVISFAATTLDTGVRIQRYICHELGDIYGVRALRSRWIAAGVAVALPFALIYAGQAGKLWVLFGASNQLLAGLSLTVVAVWLYRTGRPWLPIVVPLVVVLAVAGASMAVKVSQLVRAGDFVLAALGTVVLALEAWVVLEGIAAVRRARTLARAGEAAA
ncbi:MAG: carbon starvation protein A [Deltaproteobacteria bacterium]|nr:MAG: carbon starvation protein A [Deltaproteobacteria bacterium]